MRANTNIIYKLDSFGNKGTDRTLGKTRVGAQTDKSSFQGFFNFSSLNLAGRSVGTVGGNREPRFKMFYRGQSVDHSDPDPQRVQYGERELRRIPTTAVALIRMQPKMYTGNYPTGKDRRGWVKPISLVKRVTGETEYGQCRPDSCKSCFSLLRDP